MKYTFSTNTEATAPGSGVIKFSNANTVLRISEFDKGGSNVSSWTLTLDDSSETLKAVMTVKSVTTPANSRTYNCTGAVTDQGVYETMTVEAAGTTGAALVNGEEVNVTVAKSEGATATIGLEASATGPYLGEAEPTGLAILASVLGGIAPAGDGIAQPSLTASVDPQLALKGDVSASISLDALVAGQKALLGELSANVPLEVSAEGEKTEPIVGQIFSLSGNIIYRLVPGE